MFTFIAERFTPKFILADKNGYALARAIEAAMNIMNETIRQGAALITDVDTMPEWRLDELAWETNCLYDYNADIRTKRRWIKNAIPIYAIYGTPEGVIQFIGGYFDDVDLEEYWEYGGEEYHFRVTVDGIWTPENEAWTRRAIETAKNVRSVLDSLRCGCKSFLAIEAEGEVLARFEYPMTGPQLYAGTHPQENVLGVIDKIHQGINSTGQGYVFPYDPTSENLLSGTEPQENITLILDGADGGVTGEAEGYSFPYDMTGTAPEINTLGITGENDIQAAQASDTWARITYTLCGMDDI